MVGQEQGREDREGMGKLGDGIGEGKYSGRDS